MAPRQIGNILVGVQFALFASLVLLPAGTAWQVPAPSAFGAVAGFCFAAAAISFGSLGRARAANPVPNADGELVVTGPFKYVRHPTYTFLLLAFFAMAVRSGGWPQVGLWLLLVALFNVKSRFEERLLMAKYPPYVEYAERVGRFLPKLRRAAR